MRFVIGWGSAKVLIFASCFLLPAACCYAVEPVKIAGESTRTAQRFAEAAGLEKQQRWADAVEVYLRLADDAGDDLAPGDGEPLHLLPARRLVHRRIAARPELIAPYRARVESRAKVLFEQAQAGRDRQLLEQVVDQFFCSRSSEAALHLLGDLACERGEFDEARRYWHLLDSEDATRGLAYPDPLGGPAHARAKMILARLLAGERNEAAAELQVFKRAHADSAGHLAGRDGNLASILRSLLDGDAVRVPAAVEITPAPTTFAGDATRNGVLSGVLPPFSPQPRYPPIKLPGRPSNASASAARPVSLPSYPVISHGRVFVADARRVMAFDLTTGQISGRFELPERGEETSADGPYTLTVDGDCIYARLGRWRPARGEPAPLVCLHSQPNRSSPSERLRMKWALPPPVAGGVGEATWEGTPVVRDGRLYAAFTRFEGGRAITAIACYPSADPTAGAIWHKDVFESSADQADRSGPRLLTLAGSTVAICSHAGVIVGLEAASGRRDWALRYPSIELPNRAASLRSPAPCVFAAGRLVVAPTDSDRVYGLDATTGRLIWSSDPLAVTHLLGVAMGRAVCELGGFHAGVCALDAATGRRLPDWGYRVAGADGLAPFGRGLLFGDRVYWPTRTAGLQELRWDGSTGYVPTAFRELPGGNLAYGDGCLAVATADRLHVLVAEPAEINEPGRRLGELPPERRHDLLLWRAELLQQAGRPSEARPLFQRAAGLEFPPGRRCLALVRRAEMERDLGHDRDALEVLQSIAASNELNNVALRDADGRIWSARDSVDGSVVVQASRPQSAGGTPAPQSRRVEAGTVGPGYQLEQAWRLPLDRGREWALVPDHDPEPDRIFVAGHKWIACREVVDGKDRWRRELPFAPNWSAVVNGSLIVAGDNGAARLDAADGRPAWQFRVPESAPWFDRPRWRDPDAIMPGERLENFQWAGGRLVARLGARLLVAIDGDTGKRLWQRPALIGGSFRPEYFADECCLVAQSADGRRWAFDAATGHVLHTGPAPAETWAGPPLPLDKRRLLVVEDGRLVALDRSTWRPAWTWDLPRPVNLSGELPRTRLVNGVLLVEVARNDCYEIERLDPTTGRPLAGAPINAGREPIDLDAACVDGELLHVASDGELTTIDGTSGRIVNRRKLTDAGPWRIERIDNGLVLWTVPSNSATMPPNPGRVLLESFSEHERRQWSNPSLALGLARGNALRAVHVGGSEIVVVSEAEIRGYRGIKREVK